MTHYAPYIFSCYGLAFFLMAVGFLWVKYQRRQILKRLKQWFSREGI